MEVEKMKDLLELCERVNRETVSDAFFYYSPFYITANVYERGFNDINDCESYAAYTDEEYPPFYKALKQTLISILINGGCPA